MKIVLFRPQIPQNCGNVVRTCAVTGCELILVRPLGFSTASRHLKRAGLDYWEGVNVTQIDDLDAYLNQHEEFVPYFFSSHGKRSYDLVSYNENSLLIFGSETDGLPKQIHEKYAEQFVKIPMVANQRCLNLATSVGIGCYEALRQQGFQFLKEREERAPIA